MSKRVYIAQPAKMSCEEKHAQPISLAKMKNNHLAIHMLINFAATFDFRLFCFLWVKKSNIVKQS